MNLCRYVDGGYVCAAKNPRHCEHSLLAHWEVFCQWCNHPSICGIGSLICDKEKETKGGMMKEAIDITMQEIKWHEHNREVGPSKAYEDGFIKALHHLLNLFSDAQALDADEERRSC